MKYILCFMMFMLAGCGREVTVNQATDAGECNMRGFGLTIPDLVMGSEERLPKVALNVAFDNRPAQERADDPDACEANQYTVQISIIQSPGSRAANGPPNLRAYLKWVTNGQQAPRVVTVGDGTSISGSASGVEVSLLDVSGTPVDTSQDGYEASIVIVPGNRASTSAPPTLIPLISEASYQNPTTGTAFNGGAYQLGPRQYVIVDVPQGSGVQSVYVSPGTSLNSSLEFATQPLTFVQQLDAAGGALKTYFARNSDGFVPLGPQCNQVIIENYIPDGYLLAGTSAFVADTLDVVGTGTLYLSQVKIGDWIRSASATDAAWSQVGLITDDTHLSLVDNGIGYAGPSDPTATVAVVATYATTQGVSLTWGIDG